MSQAPPYLMENLEETLRLEFKTDAERVKQQARWCGVRPGLRILDAGCGPGKTSSIIHDLLRQDGELLGIDYSEERIRHAKERYGGREGIDFQVCDLKKPLDHLGLFDLVWVRFVLEYNLAQGPDIIKNLTSCLKPGGTLCLLDLDHNCLNHYGMPAETEHTLFELMAVMEAHYNFDPYAGRKLYAYLYDAGYENIRLDLRAHHLIYGKLSDSDAFNWLKKVEVAPLKVPEVLKKYPGGHDGFLSDFLRFFSDSRRFTYTPLIMCKGMKPQAS